MMNIIRKPRVTIRADRKQKARHRILDAASARLREEGLAGGAIAAIMQEAGLTHGAFYAHFADKAALDEAGFRHALCAGRVEWIGTVRDRTWQGRLARLARQYLRPWHRDNRASGCAFAALGADAARASEDFRRAFAEELQKSLDAICGTKAAGPPRQKRADDAILLMALCVGGLTLARAVGERRLSNSILSVCRKAAVSAFAAEKTGL
jgi:TetR/AcrR family transcriptional regulator, transcriptional repressor for nem operon